MMITEMHRYNFKYEGMIKNCESILLKYIYHWQWAWVCRVFTYCTQCSSIAASTSVAPSLAVNCAVGLHWLHYNTG